MLLVVPGPDPEPWPTLGPGICDLIEERAVYGPGSLQGEPYVIDPEFRAFIYRAYEVYPRGHAWAGRRRFKRVGLSVRKGLAKTEKQALLALCELHPDGPTRFDGWDAAGDPVGRPVRAPYIPMLAVSVEQVEELAFGALTYIVTEGPDADLFDVSLERICRLDERGKADGKAVPLANSPGARDGARTTMNCFDEPHRLFLTRQLQAHQTMDANLPKRPLDDPWSLYVGTAGEPGQNSVMEQIHGEALLIAEGKVDRPDLFYLYRTDDGGRDLSVKDERIAAVAEATGPAGEFGPGQFDEIASKWDRPGADKAFLERVWLNRWVKSGSQAFDMTKVVHSEHSIPDGAFVTAGFDGSRWRDATAVVITEIATGRQTLLGCWERPEFADEWEVPEREVTDLVADMMSRFDVWRLYCDPWGWDATIASWAGSYPDRVVEWAVGGGGSQRRVAAATQSYSAAVASGEVSLADDVWRPKLVEHMGHAGRRELKMLDDTGQPLWVMQKQDGRLGDKFDAAMAGMLSWTACVDARRDGAAARPKVFAPRRIY